MWTIYHIKYVDTHENKKYTVYFKSPGGTTLATNFQEPGLHYSGKPKMDHPTLTSFDAIAAKHAMTQSPTVLDWHGDIVHGYFHYQKLYERVGGKSVPQWILPEEAIP